MDIAAKSDPSSVYNAFLRLRIHLSRHDSQAAADQVKAMLTCDDFTHEILRVGQRSHCTVTCLQTCMKRHTGVHLCQVSGDKGFAELRQMQHRDAKHNRCKQRSQGG